MKIRRFFSLFFSLLTLAVTSQAQTDPVVMTINGKDVKLSEFEYSYNKNNSEGVIDRKSVEDYVPLFVNFKLKVAAAEEAKYDTISSLQQELRSYREQMLMPTLSDPDFIEQQARLTYDNTAAVYAGSDILTASHILVLMSPDASAAEQIAAKARIDSIYQALQDGADFATLAREHSDDKATAVRGGSLGQFGKGRMIPDFENAAYALKAGETSQPVKTTVGWHIIKLEDRHPFESYEFHHDQIVRFLESRGIRESAAQHLVDSLAKKEGVSRDQEIDRLFNKMIAADAEQRFLAQEFYDGTLMFEISKKEIWDVADADIAGQERYFAEHKKQYAWDSPRYRGIVYYCKDQATAEAAKKILKKEKDYSKWEELLTKTFNRDSTKQIVVSQGIFRQGDDPTIDNLAFGQSTQVKTLANYPVVNIYGKMLKKPETLNDVRGQVESDYRRATEDEWVEQLRKKYQFTVDHEVLGKVKPIVNEQ